MSTAPAFVRVASPDEAGILADLQRNAWAARYALVLPAEVLAATAIPTEAWQQMLLAAHDWPASRALALIAESDGEPVGMVASLPAEDPDLADDGWVEIAELAVADAHVNQGHGSRLLAAWADHCHADPSLNGGVMWVHAGDDELRGLLTASGFAPDGAHRTLDLRGDGTVTVQMLRVVSTFTREG